jgi:hypothetical protein
MRNFIHRSTSVFTSKLGLFLFTLIFSGLIAGNVCAQTVLVNYDFATAVAGTPCTVAPLTTAPGVVPVFTTGGTGGGTCTTPAGTAAAAPPAFVANASNQSVSLTSFAAGSSNYFQVQLTGVATYTNYQLFFQTQRSGTGPVNADVQYSTDGTTFTTFQSITVPTAFAPFNIDLSAVSAIENQPVVYFRILGNGGTGAAGTFRIDNLQVAASVVTAAGANIAGQVRTANGRGIGDVYVTVSGGGLSEPMLAITSPFGYYSFENLPVGDTYIISVASKQYTFKNPSRAVRLEDNLTDQDFVSNEP